MLTEDRVMLWRTTRYLCVFRASVALVAIGRHWSPGIAIFSRNPHRGPLSSVIEMLFDEGSVPRLRCKEKCLSKEL